MLSVFLNPTCNAFADLEYTFSSLYSLLCSMQLLCRISVQPLDRHSSTVLFQLWNARSYDSPVASHLYNRTFGVSSFCRIKEIDSDVDIYSLQHLDVTEILNSDLSLNEAKYEELGPLRLVPYFALSYGISFAILTSAITSVLLWNLKDIKKALSARKGDKGDVHVQLLERNYSNVPRS